MNFRAAQEFKILARVLQGKMVESLQKLDFQIFRIFMVGLPQVAPKNRILEQSQMYTYDFPKQHH